VNNLNTEHAEALAMNTKHETIAPPKKEHLKKANKLSKLASTNLVLRVGRHHFDELISAGISGVDALALLLEREEATLNEWRKAVDKIRAEGNGKA
jgi:hypothetical protein